MDLQGIKDRLKEIRELAGDDERAHSLEDELYEVLLQHCAIHCKQCGPLAIEALKSQEIKFERWCA